MGLDHIKEDVMKTITAFAATAMRAVKWIMAVIAFLILFLVSSLISDYVFHFINLLINILPFIFVSSGALFYIFGSAAIIHHLSISYPIFNTRFFMYMTISFVGAIIFKTSVYSIFNHDSDLSLDICLAAVPILVIVLSRLLKSQKYPYLIKFIKSKITAWLDLTERMSRISVSGIFTKPLGDYCNSMKVRINNLTEYLHNMMDHRVKLIQEGYVTNVLNQSVKSSGGPSAYFLKIEKMPTTISDKNGKVHVWCKISASMKSIDLMKCDNCVECVEWMNRLGVQVEFIGVGFDKNMMNLKNTWTSLMLLYVSPADLLKKFAISRNHIISRMTSISSIEPYSAFNDEYDTWYLSVQNPDLPSIDDMIKRKEMIERHLKYYLNLYQEGNISEYFVLKIKHYEKERNKVKKFIQRISKSAAKGTKQ